jgi:glycerol kinase
MENPTMDLTTADICMQLQADILGIEVERPVMRESTALGSAICAGVAMGLFGWDLSKPETLAKVNVSGKTTFKPENDEADRAKGWKGWEKAVSRARHWNDETGLVSRTPGAFESDELQVPPNKY